jgi:hypothetical protein
VFNLTAIGQGIGYPNTRLLSWGLGWRWEPNVWDYDGAVQVILLPQGLYEQEWPYEAIPLILLFEARRTMMKQDDKGTDLIFTVKDRNGSVIDLTGASAAMLYLKLNDGAVLAKAMSFLDRPNGKVKYEIEPGILSAPGKLEMEVEINFDANNVFRCDAVIEEVKKKLS